MPTRKVECVLSVPEPLRHKGRLEVHVKAQYLASYTIKILANDKTFPPEIDGELVKRIKDSAISIYAKAWSANKINASTNKVNREMRYRLQREAWMLCNELLAYIGIAKQVFHLREKRMKYWSWLIISTQALIQSWIDSDVERYGQP